MTNAYHWLALQRLRRNSHWLTTLHMGKKDVQIGVRMSSELRDKLRRLAETDGRTFASYVVRVLEEHVRCSTEKPSRRRR